MVSESDDAGLRLASFGDYALRAIFAARDADLPDGPRALIGMP